MYVINKIARYLESIDKDIDVSQIHVLNITNKYLLITKVYLSLELNGRDHYQSVVTIYHLFDSDLILCETPTLCESDAVRYNAMVRTLN